MTERGQMSPELRETLRANIDKAYRGGRRDDGMSPVDYAVQLLEPILLSMDTNAHNRGRREMANEVDDVLSRGRGTVPNCDWRNCFCATAQVWRLIQDNKGEIL